jgi:hypothetical protein
LNGGTFCDCDTDANCESHAQYVALTGKCRPMKKNEDGATESLFPYDPLELLTNAYFSKIKNQLTMRELDYLRRSIMNQREPDEKLLDVYNNANKYIKERKRKELVIHDGEVQQIPNPNNRECIYISAPSGAGKTTYMANYGSKYKKLFPDKDIFVISKIPKDEPLDKLKPIRIQLENEIIKDITPDTLKNSLIIFDDTDTIRSVTKDQKMLKDNVESLKSELLEEGRHPDVYTLISSHAVTDYKRTRCVLNECHWIVIYPNSGSSKQWEYCLKQYFGLGKDDINRIKKLPSRWVAIRTRAPQLVMYDKGIYLLK